MSQPSGSGTPSRPVVSQTSTPKAIGSLAKKQDDVTRQGAQKLKFVPTLPTRRKKVDCDVKQEPTSSPSASTSTPRSRGRGRGREGRGAAPSPRPPIEMTASGPFALGPAMGGTPSRRAAPRSNFAPITPLGPGRAASLGAGLTKTTAPSLKQEPVDQHSMEAAADKNEDAYSDPDEGVEIIDMSDVRQLDWMAPESLRKEEDPSKKARVKREGGGRSTLTGKQKGVPHAKAKDVDGVDLVNALDLSESEEEEEMEDLMDDFALQGQEMDNDLNVRAENLYFFQFPEPFPTFMHPAPEAATESAAIGVEKKVTFAEDTKEAPGSSAGSTPAAASDVKLDGIIGQLEIYQSGAVKMRMANGMVFDVSAATQPSFLQHAVHLDMENKRLSVLGEVNRRFVVSPNMDSLLEKLEEDRRQPSIDVDSVK